MVIKDSTRNDNRSSSSSKTVKEDSAWEAFLGYETPQCLAMNRASDPTLRSKVRRQRRPRSGSLSHSSRANAHAFSSGSPSIGQRQLRQATVASSPVRASAGRQRQQRRKSTGGALSSVPVTTDNHLSPLMNDSSSRRRIRIGSSSARHPPKQTSALDRLSLFTNAMGAISDRALTVEPPMLASTHGKSKQPGVATNKSSPEKTTRRRNRGSVCQTSNTTASTTRGSTTRNQTPPPQHQRKRISERVGRVGRNTIGAVRKGSIMSRRLSSN